MATTTKGSHMNIYPDITRLESIVRELTNIQMLFDDRAITLDEAAEDIQRLRGNLEDIVADIDI
jgi:hypothetical protein